MLLGHPKEVDYFSKNHQTSFITKFEHPLARNQHEHYRRSSKLLGQKRANAS
jgi:hypothetical protein